jgi:hypothetical protein
VYIGLNIYHSSHHILDPSSCSEWVPHDKNSFGWSPFFLDLYLWWCHLWVSLNTECMNKEDEAVWHDFHAVGILLDICFQFLAVDYSQGLQSDSFLCSKISLMVPEYSKFQLWNFISWGELVWYHSVFAFAFWYVLTGLIKVHVRLKSDRTCEALFESAPVHKNMLHTICADIHCSSNLFNGSLPTQSLPFPWYSLASEHSLLAWMTFNVIHYM